MTLDNIMQNIHRWRNESYEDFDANVRALMLAYGEAKWAEAVKATLRIKKEKENA